MVIYLFIFTIPFDFPGYARRQGRGLRKAGISECEKEKLRKELAREKFIDESPEHPQPAWLSVQVVT